jgi:SpoVK/Ycf46/Vps4 family AAA+-type ATPase
LETVISRSGSVVGVQHAAPTVPVDGESRYPLADELYPKKDDIQLYLDDRILDRIKEFLSHVQFSDELLAAGVGITPTMLLHGPPGTGKSLTAQYVAASLGLPLLVARVDTLVSSYLGSTSKNIRNLFEHASRRPCVLFLDELDALGKLRDDQHEMGELKRVVIALLQNIDNASGNLVLLAATNHPHILDRAIWRRFQFHVSIELPTEPVRQDLIANLLTGESVSFSVNKIASLTVGLSCADITGIVRDSIRHRVVSKEVEVSFGYLIRRIIESRLGMHLSGELPEPHTIWKIHQLNEKVLTLRVLADLFNVSPPTIGRRLKEASAEEVTTNG